jgi:AmmeMemoRadiSam system protein A
MLNNESKKIIKKIAKKSLETYIKKGEILSFESNNENLLLKTGAFVTLKNNDKLRGCIGLIKSDRPLWETIRDMSIAAGTQDDRFIPVNEEELEDIRYEISVLTPFKKITDWRNVRPGIDGVLIKKDSQNGLFLPQVASENNWDTEDFLSNLCQFKAGLKKDAYKNDPDVEIYTFEAIVF